MMLYARYTAEQISRSDALHLASGGFCFLVVEILLEMFPGAKVVRLTDKEGNRFVHVYVSVDGQRSQRTGQNPPLGVTPKPATLGGVGVW